MSISRRSFLRGTLSGVAFSVGLPIFEQQLNGHGTAFAQGAPLPLRFGTWFWGLGWPSINGGGDDYKPSGSGQGAAWSLPSGLQQLAAHKDYLTVFSNYSYQAANGAAHIPSRGISLSASHNPEWVLDSGASGFRNQSMPLPTIDALVHESWGNPGTLFSYLNMSLRVGNLYESTSSWNRGGSFRAFHKSPVELYNAVFAPLQGGGAPMPSGPTAAQVTNGFRKSVLDVVSDDLKATQAKLGRNDQLRLQAHLQSVTELERRIALLAQADAGTAGGTMTPTCGGVTRPPAYSGASEVRARNDAMADLLVYALSCNLTRLFCFEFTPTQCSGTMPEIGLSDGEGVHDTYSHGDNAEMRRYCKFVMDGLGYLVGKLKATPDGAGNLLDNLLMVATSECGPVHYHDYHPYLFVGKAKGRVKGNYHATKASPSNNEGARVLLTAAHAAGAMLPKLGMPATPVTGAGSGNTVNYEVTAPVSEVLV